MKRIVISAIVFFFLFTTASFAQHSEYDIGDHIKIAFPNDWKVNLHDNNHQVKRGFLLEAVAPNNSPKLGLFVYDNQNKSIDEIIQSTQKSISELDKSMTLEESGQLNTNLRFLLYSFNKRNGEKHYCLDFISFYEQYYYHISIFGYYGDLEENRKTITDIISSIKHER